MKAIYQDIAEKILRYYRQFPSGKRMPGCTHLVRYFQINRRTVLKALHELEAQNLVTIEEKRGIYLRTKPSAPVFRQVALIGFDPEKSTRQLLYRELKRRGYTPISIQFDEDAFENNPRGLLNFPVDGFLFRYSRSFTRKQAEVFRSGDRFAVSLAELPGCDWIDFYPQNIPAAMTLALDKLHEAGHRRIAWITVLNHEDYRKQVEEYLQLFRKLQGEDFRAGDCLVFPRDAFGSPKRSFAPELFAEALAEFRNRPEPPTALLFRSGNIAGMMQTYLPELCKTYSFAGLYENDEPPPRWLSCTVSDCCERAQRAAERLLCRIEGGTPPVENLPGNVSWQQGETVREIGNRK